jgi:predicted Zn-dependent protease
MISGVKDLSLRRVSSVVLAVTALFLAAASCGAVSLREEIKIGEDTTKIVLKQMPLLKDQKQQDSIGVLGHKLVPFVKRKDIPYHFAIVTDKDNSINAFALPGGYVFFTERMWKLLTPDERAAVMAHEMTHCDLRHGINESIKQQQRMLWTLPLIALGGGVGAEAWMFGNMAVNARYSRVAEREADEQGIQLAVKAGFSPAGAVTSMKKLLSIENDTNRYEVSALFADHPDTEKRVDYLTQQALKLGAKPSQLELAADDDPSRIGNISKKIPDLSVLYARSSQSLEFGQKVLIKKMLWDEDKKALDPKVIAEATVLTPGRFPTLVLSNYKDYNISDVMIGDGVYSAP